MVKIYCGPEQKLPSEDYDRRGTRYECLRKGVGVGIHIPSEHRSLPKPKPPNSPKKYCGDKEILPKGYDNFASEYECLKKGVGVGLYKSASKEESKEEEKDYRPPPPSPKEGDAIKIILPQNLDTAELDLDIDVRGRCTIS